MSNGHHQKFASFFILYDTWKKLNDRYCKSFMSTNPVMFFRIDPSASRCNLFTCELPHSTCQKLCTIIIIVIIKQKVVGSKEQSYIIYNQVDLNVNQLHAMTWNEMSYWLARYLTAHIIYKLSRFSK